MAVEDAKSWSYWRDKKGFETALEDYFPKILASNPVIAQAAIQIKIAKLAIDAEMSRLAEGEDHE